MTILEHCHGRKVMSLWVKEIIASIKRRKKAVQFQWVIIIISHAPWILYVLCVCVCKNLIFTLAALNILGKGVHKKALGIKLWWLVS